MEKRQKTIEEEEQLNFPRLPKDVLPLIFSFICCSHKKFCRLSLVCKNFRELLLLHSDMGKVEDALITSVIVNGL